MKKVYIVAFYNLLEEEQTSTNDAVFDNFEEAIKYCNIQNEYWNKVTETNKDCPWYKYYIVNIKPLRTKAILKEKPAE